MNRINLSILIVLSIIIGSILYLEVFDASYTSLSNALYYLWDKGKDLLFPVEMAFIYLCYDKDRHYKSWVNVFIWASCVFLFIRTQHGYYVDTGYNEDTGTIIVLIDDAMVVIPCFAYLYKYTKDFNKSLFE